jgi:hypothetical protein
LVVIAAQASSASFPELLLKGMRNSGTVSLTGRPIVRVARVACETTVSMDVHGLLRRAG